MNIDNLVKMANQISAFYDGESEKNAAENVASHLRKYWEPRMRLAIIAHCSAGGEGLRDSAKAAVAMLAKAAAA